MLDMSSKAAQKELDKTIKEICKLEKENKYLSIKKDNICKKQDEIRISLTGLYLKKKQFEEYLRRV